MNQSKPSVAVLGAGHGGMALAAYLSQRGHDVLLWNRSVERVAAVSDRGGIRLTSAGADTIHAPIAHATCHMAEAVSNASVVLVTVPACAHADVARTCAPYLKHGQTVLLMPGRTGGALEFRCVLRKAGCRAQILLGEANTFPFAARSPEPACAVIYGAKAEVLAAALPARRTAELLAACRPFLPMLCRARSVLHTGLANLGAILHPVITLLNADRIERGESFDFYREGVTSPVAAALAAADAERRRIARAYSEPTCSLTDWIAKAYHHRANNVQEAVGGNPAYIGIKAPTTLAHRYLLEDVPTGLIPLLELGRIAGLGLPVLSSLVERSRLLLGRQCWQRQRTLDALGLDGLNTASLRSFVQRGVAPTRTRNARAGSFSLRSLVPSLKWIPSLQPVQGIA